MKNIKMKIFSIFILLSIVSSSLANNKERQGTFNLENLERWLNAFQKSRSNIDQTSEDNKYNLKSNERFYHHDNPLVISDSYSGIDYENDSPIDYEAQPPQFSYLIRNPKPKDISSRSSYTTHTHRTIFQSLCPTTSQMFILSSPEYEYRLDRYQNITCSNTVLQSTPPSSLSSSSSLHDIHNTNVCEQIGFKCVQHRRTQILNVRKQGNDCWKTESITIDSGCECVMPV